jgi:integrase
MSRKNHDGSFRKLANGTIEFVVSIGFDAYGKHQRKRFYGKTELECRKKHKDFMKGGESQQVQAKEHTLSKWLDEWLKIYKENNVQASTYIEYVNLVNHIKHHKIGNMKLSQVKPIHITEFFTSIIDYSHSFRKRMKFLLNGAFECAIDNDLCAKNPVRRAEIAKKSEPDKEAFTENETRIITEFARTDELFGVTMCILFNTGIRSGEMRALTIDKFDFENDVVKIDKAIKRTGELGKPKNGKTRYIPLEPEVAAYLKPRLKGKTGFVIGGDHFVTHSGFRGRYECFFSRLNIFLEENGEKPIEIKSPHSTRHTFSTLRQRGGMPTPMVMELLGHSSLAMTELYTHLGDIATLSEAVKEYDFLD